MLGGIQVCSNKELGEIGRVCISTKKITVKQRCRLIREELNRLLAQYPHECTLGENTNDGAFERGT